MWYIHLYKRYLVWCGVWLAQTCPSAALVCLDLCQLVWNVCRKMMRLVSLPELNVITYWTQTVRHASSQSAEMTGNTHKKTNRIVFNKETVQNYPGNGIYFSEFASCNRRVVSLLICTDIKLYFLDVTEEQKCTEAIETWNVLIILLDLTNDKVQTLNSGWMSHIQSCQKIV